MRLGKWIDRLETIATRLEVVAQQLERERPVVAEPASSETMARIIVAAEAVLERTFLDVRTAILAGQRDRAVLLQLADGPWIEAAATVPLAQATSAARGFITCVLVRLIDRLVLLEEAAIAQRAAAHGNGARVERN